MAKWIDHVLKTFDWVHGAVFIASACFYVWSWSRTGCRVPWYVHAIALVALIVGILITLSLPPPVNPDPVAQFLFPFIFPALAVVAAYTIPVAAGFLHLLSKQEQESAQSSESADDS